MLVSSFQKEKLVGFSVLSHVVLDALRSQVWGGLPTWARKKKKAETVQVKKKKKKMKKKAAVSGHKQTIMK